MKKIALLFGMLVFFALPVTAFADAPMPDVESLPENGSDSSISESVEPGERATAEVPLDSSFQQLFETWMDNGYPDDVGGVYYDSDTGKHVIYLTSLDPSRMEEIRSISGEPDAIDFELADYSYNELLAVQEEIAASDLDGERVYGIGIGGNVVAVYVSPEYADEYAEKYHALYGDMVHVEGSDPVVPEDDAAQSSMLLLTTTLTPFALAAMFFFFWNRQRVVAMQTTGGRVVTAGGRVNRKQVVQAVQQSGIPPTDGVFDRIMNSI